MARLSSDTCDYCKHCYDCENWSCDIEEPCINGNMFDSDNFEKFRGKVLEELNNRNERVVRNFFWRINYKGIVGYENDLGKKEFTLWTDRPGILIGKGGQNVEILKEILKEEFEYDYEIKFKEIKGKMIIVL